MQPHQQRVVAEKAGIDENIVKLSKFVHGPLFQTIDDAERDRLHRQLGAMTLLSDILGDRIQAFGTDKLQA